MSECMVVNCRDISEWSGSQAGRQSIRVGQGQGQGHSRGHMVWHTSVVMYVCMPAKRDEGKGIPW